MGCGVMSQPSPTPSSLSLPDKISVEIPKVLKSKEDQNTAQNKILVERIEGQASGYRAVKEYTDKFLEVLDEMHFNLFLGNLVIKDIEKQCKSTPINTICTLPPNSLSFIVNDKIVAQHKTLFDLSFAVNRPLSNLLHQELFFGEIEFIKHDLNASYHYSLQMDMSNIINKLNFEITPPTILQHIQWSEDKNQTFSSLSKTLADNDNNAWTLLFYAKENEEKMHLSDYSYNILQGFINRTFSLDKVEEQYHAQLNSITSIPIRNNVTVETQHSSRIGLNPNEGFQKFTQTDRANNYYKINKEEVFDSNGSLLATSYCDSDACKLYDTTTWYIDNNESLFEPLKKIGFEELKVTENTLKEGEYLLVPKEYAIDKMSRQEVLDVRVGEFVKLKELTQGILYDTSYRYKLDELQLLYTVYNTQLGSSLKDKPKKLFEVITQENLPNITLWSLE